MKTIFGYLKTLKNYCKTKKGRHDVKDYAKAAALFFMTCVAMAACLYLFCGDLQK